MSDRTVEIMAAVNKKLAKNKASHERRAAKRQKTDPVGELHREWISVMSSELNLETIPRWAGAEYALAKKLLNELGFDKSVRFVTYFVETWMNRRTAAQARREEIPSMRVCWAQRAQVLAEMEGAVNRPKSKRERLLRGEFDQELADASPMEGWGD